MTKRQLVKWLEAKQSDAKAEVEIQYATAEKAYFAQRDEALKINETVDEVFRLISEADTVANRWKEALEKVEGIDTTRGWCTSLTTKLSAARKSETISSGNTLRTLCSRVTVISRLWCWHSISSSPRKKSCVFAITWELFAISPSGTIIHERCINIQMFCGHTNPICSLPM